MYVTMELYRNMVIKGNSNIDREEFVFIRNEEIAENSKDTPHRYF